MAHVFVARVRRGGHRRWPSIGRDDRRQLGARSSRKVKDYGWRAIHETAVESKRILRDLTSKSPAKSYFVGCSDGGPRSVDDGAALPDVFRWHHSRRARVYHDRLLTGGALRTVELGGSAAHLSTPQLMLLQSRALQSCGNGDSYFEGSAPVPRRNRGLEMHRQRDGLLSVRSANQNRTGHVRGAQKILRAADRFTACCRAPKASRAVGCVAHGVRTIKHMQPAAHSRELSGVYGDARSEAWTSSACGHRSDTRRAAGTLWSWTPTNPTSRHSRAHGGKLIQYHGWNDSRHPAGLFVGISRPMTAKTGGANDFYRLYMVPGMLHCSGGDAPTNVNWQAALESWVEKSEAPGDLVASDGKGATQILGPFN